MDIYFAGSIRGGREDVQLYAALVKYLQSYGTVLSEHIGDKTLTDTGEQSADKFIHDRDLGWLFQSNVVVAEVTQPSLGVGYELGRLVGFKRTPILALYRPQEGKRLSTMISGCPNITVSKYHTLDEAVHHIDSFMMNHRFQKK